MLFHNDPERYVTGAFIKIGYFKKNANLIFQDEVHGSLFQQVKLTMDLLLTKYLRALINYEGIQRIETLPIPKEALREALLNAIVHKAYESLTPIQISVFDDRLEIFNCGYLPEDWNIDKLLGKHNSRPYNPDIANAFFRAGEIEAWGRGIERIISTCKNAGVPKPSIKYTNGELLITFHFSKEYRNVVSNSQGSIAENIVENKNSIVENIVEKLPENQSRIVRIILANPSVTTKEIADNLSIAQRNIQKHIRKLKEAGVIRRVGPDKGGYWEVVV